jgi:multidrug efflux system membrane fusion protein
MNNPPVPIVAETVERQDVSIYLFGLGTVQAFNTVRVGSRVDGQLQRLGFQEGQDVRAGDVLAQIDPLPFQAALRQMEANLRRDQAQLRSAKADFERTLALATRDLASRQNVDIRRSSVEQIEAAIAADQAQIDNAKIQLEYTVIRSPMDGRAGLRLIDEGNMIRASDPTGIVVVMQLQPIAVIFTLPEEDLPKINNRLSAGSSPAVTAFGRDGQTVLAEGVLATVDNVIDRRTGTFKLKAHFANERKTLWPGQFVNARIHLATRRDGIVVSEAAVQRGPEGTYVFIIEPDNSAALRTIHVAQTENGTALIDDGLMPGERVVVEGQHRLQAGSRIVQVKQN